jgi:alkylhydroperoxidase family enzyme
MKAHGRLPWPTPAELDEPAQRLYEKVAGGRRVAGPQAFALTDADGRLHGPFNVMLMSPGIGTALQELGSVIRYDSSLPARAREIAILELARVRSSEFEWYAHRGVGEQVGLTAAELSSLRAGTDAPTFTPAEALVRDLVRELVLERDLDDAAYGRGVEALGQTGVVDLIALVGYYETLALMLRAFRTPLPDGIEPAFSATQVPRRRRRKTTC